MSTADLIAAWELALVNGPIVITPALIAQTVRVLKALQDVHGR